MFFLVSVLLVFYFVSSFSLPFSLLSCSSSYSRRRGDGGCVDIVWNISSRPRRAASARSEPYTDVTPIRALRSRIDTDPDVHASRRNASRVTDFTSDEPSRMFFFLVHIYSCFIIHIVVIAMMIFALFRDEDDQVFFSLLFPPPSPTFLLFEVRVRVHDWFAFVV